MWYINLVNVKYRAFHGVYEEEQILGNDFILNVSVGFENENINNLEDSINYELIYNLLNKEMVNTKKLLEEVIVAVAESIKNKFPTVLYQKISLKKIAPAFAKNTEATEVVLEKKYS